MNTKLLGAVAGCVLVALTVGAANADTYFLSGTFGPGVDSSMCGYQTPCNTVWPGFTFTAMLDVTPASASITDLSFSLICCQPPIQQTWTPPNLHLFAGNIGTLWGTLDLVFDFADDTFTARYFYGHDIHADRFEYVSATWTGTGTMTTPLPTALPLFATGLGALGLLGWRRNRKAQAAA